MRLLRVSESMVKQIPTLPAIILLACSVILALWDTSLFIFHAWSDFRGFHPHGFLLVGMVIYLLWLSREQWLVQRQEGPMYFWWLWLIGAASLWVIAWGLDFRPAEVLGYGAMIFGGCCLLLGPGSFATFGKRAGILLFGIPIWYNLNPILQSIAAVVSENLLFVFGYTVFLEGNSISIPIGTFEVADGCSGLGYLLTNASLVTFYMFESDQSVRATIVPFIVAIVLALLINWLRITLIIAIAYHYGMDHPIVYDHVWFGWVLYAIVMTPIFIFSVRWLDRQATDKDHSQQHV